MSGLVGDLLGTTNTLGAPLNDLLGDLTGAGGLNLGGVVGDVLATATGLVGGLTGNLNGSEVGGSLTTGGLGGLLDPVLGSDSPLAPVTDILNDLTGGLTGGLLGSGTTVAGGGDLGEMSSGLLGQVTGPVEGLLGDLPILSLADTGANLGTGTDLLSSLLNTLNGSASTGVLDLSTSNLPVSADGLLGTLNGADPTGGLLGPVTGLLAPVTSAARRADAGLTAKDIDDVVLVGGKTRVTTRDTGQCAAISSVTDLGHNSPWAAC